MRAFGQPTSSEDTMSIKATIIAEVQQLAEREHKDLPPLTEDLVLLDSGLDSLMIAILVARLEETLGLDPFTDSDDIYYPVTLGDFIRAYEHASHSR
jgi:acyl carrier protein